MAIRNIHVDYNGYRYSIGWSDDEARYHVWSDDGVSVQNETVSYRQSVRGKSIIYKNPPLNADGSHKKRRDPGYFDTRYLNASKSTGQKMLTEVFAFVREKNLIAQAKELWQKKEDKQNEENQRAANLIEHARSLYKRLHDIGNHEGFMLDAFDVEALLHTQPNYTKESNNG